MTDQDSFSQSSFNKSTDNFFTDLTKPDSLSLSKLRRWLSPSSSNSFHFARFSIFAILMLFMTCATERRCKLSNALLSAMRTPVCVLLKFGEFCIVVFYFSRCYFQTTSLPWDYPLVVPVESLHLAQGILKCFCARFVVTFHMILRKGFFGSGNLCFQWLFLVVVSPSDIFMGTSTGSMSSPTGTQFISSIPTHQFSRKEFTIS